MAPEQRSLAIPSWNVAEYWGVARRELQSCSSCSVRLDELQGDVRVAAARDAALGGDAKLADVALRGGDARHRAVDAALDVHEPQIQLRSGSQLQFFEGRVKRVIGSIERHRHVHPGDRAL